MTAPQKPLTTIDDGSDSSSERLRFTFFFNALTHFLLLLLTSLSVTSSWPTHAALLVMRSAKNGASSLDSCAPFATHTGSA